MTENDRFMNFLKKKFEAYYLTFRHYIPLGKPIPDSYRDMFFEDYKQFDCGVLEEWSREPVIEGQAVQLDIFLHFRADIVAERSNGSIIADRAVNKIDSYDTTS